MTTDIVSAHVANNTVSLAELPGLIHSVYRTLANIGPAPAEATDRPRPAVPVRKSVMPDYIVCLEDGKKLKMLKRHLKTAYNMTPGAVPRALGPAGRLSDGRAELCQAAQPPRQGDRPRHALAPEPAELPAERWARPLRLGAGSGFRLY